MFDDLIREFRDLERGIEVHVPIEPDEDGYIDKECPSELCLFQFKVFEQDWIDLVSDDAVFCPLCGYSAPADHWFTSEQLRHSEREAVAQLEEHIDNAVQRSARTFNQRQPQSGFVRMSMEVRGTRARRAIIPVPGTDRMDLRITCESCRARFAVVGSAFFCPACGVTSAARVFDDSLRKVRLKIQSSETLRTTYHESGQRDDGEILARSLLETALSDCVVAFQRLCEQLYIADPGANPPRPNVFQRLKDGSALWRESLGQGYEDWLAQDELNDLTVLFNRRHLLQHTEGMVDQRYLDQSGDPMYNVGQRIVVRRHDVARAADLVSRLADALRSRLAA